MPISSIPIPSLFGHEPIVWAQRLFGPGYPEWFRALSELGSTWGVVFVVGMALTVWGRREAYAVVGLVVVEGVVTTLLNVLFAVPRPSHPSIIRYEVIPLGSFPSGHLLLATLLWGVLYARGRIGGWLFASVMVAVSVARLYLGVHFLGDLLGAALIGVVMIAGFRPAWDRAEGWLRRRPTRVYVALGMACMVATLAALALGILGSNAYERHAAGVVLGGVPALLLEHRFLRFTAGAGERRSVALRVAVVLAGVAPLVLLDHTLHDVRWAGLGLIAGGALWAVLVTPVLVDRFGRRDALHSGRSAVGLPG